MEQKKEQDKQPVVAKCTYEGKFGAWSFTITKHNNKDRYDDVHEATKKLETSVKQWKPLFIKEYKETEFISLNAKLGPAVDTPTIGEYYQIAFQLYKTKGKWRAVISRMEIKEIEKNIIPQDYEEMVEL